jgi:radical SAM superfamily enzyme YgiQ (UPF0313 family)
MMENLEDLGICFIASFLRQKGYEVILYRVNEVEVDFDKIVEQFPGIIGLPVYDVSKDSVARVIEKIKLLLPGIYICVGGPLPTYSHIEMMREFPLIDFAVRGEGELTFWELVSQLSIGDKKNLENIKGLTYRDGEMIKANETRPLIRDINTLPMPARDILEDNGLKSASISTSRGCMGGCSFCISHLFWKKWRGRSVEKVLDEIEYITEKYNIKTFNFIDESIEDPGTDLKRLRDIARGIVKRRLNISYFGDIRSNFHRKATPELMELLKESGLCGVCVGIESANEPDMKLYGKLATIEDNIKIIQLLQNYEIIIQPGFINFNPYSTFDGLKKNIAFLEKYGFTCNLYYVVSRAIMYKGTYLYLKTKKDSLLITRESQYNENRYRFVDERIEHLYNHIDAYFSTIDKNFNADLIDLSYFSNGFLTLLNYLKRQFKLNKEIKGFNYVVQHENQNKQILADINHHAAQWFKKLLSLAENGWDAGKAGEISNTNLSPDYIKNSAAMLRKNEIRLNKILVKMNLDTFLIKMF